MKKTISQKSIISKVTAVVLGALIFSNIAVMGVHAAFPNDNFTLATIQGDGVALRKEASESSTRLELMYKGEKVHLNINYNQINGWSQVKRVSTGTVGFSASKYVQEDW